MFHQEREGSFKGTKFCKELCLFGWCQLMNECNLAICSDKRTNA